MRADTNAELDVRRSAPEHYVLHRLRQDHENILSCLDALARQARDILQTRLDIALTDAVMKPFIDAPDDFHHILERKAYRRLWFRCGRYMPRYFDLDEVHSELRNARENLVDIIGDERQSGFCGKDSGMVIDRYVERTKASIRGDETMLFPMLARHLKPEDWEELADDFKAYDLVAADVRSMRPKEPA